MTLSNLQLAVVEVLSRDPWLVKRNATVLAEDKGNIIAYLQNNLAKLGVAVVVSTPRLAGDTPDSFIPTGNSDVVVSCFETPLLNRGVANRTTALNAAERVACVLARLPQLSGKITGEQYGPPSFVKIESGMVGENQREAMLVYDVTVRIRVALNGDMDAEPHQPSGAPGGLALPGGAPEEHAPPQE